MSQIRCALRPRFPFQAGPQLVLVLGLSWEIVWAFPMAVWRPALRDELRNSIRVGLFLLVCPQGVAHSAADIQVFH